VNGIFGNPNTGAGSSTFCLIIVIRHLPFFHHVPWPATAAEAVRIQNHQQQKQRPCDNFNHDNIKKIVATSLSNLIYNQGSIIAVI
jgi:hypothetical protein